MPFSGGTFALYSTGNPVVTGTTISSTWANNTLSDIASNGLSYCVLKDGTQTLTANLPMSSFKLTGLGAGSARTDSARLSQIQDSTALFLTTVAGTNTVTAVLTPAITAYASGQQFLLDPANTNTGATTLNINSVGAGAVQLNGAALAGGELKQGTPCVVAVVTTTPVFEIVGNGANVNGTQTRVANTVLAGPASGGDAAPTFRALVNADIALFSQIRNELSGNVTLTNQNQYYDGPSIAQGSTGTWWASGTVAVSDSGAACNFQAKLWDGTTVIASGYARTAAAGSFVSIALAGYLATPAGNLRISVQNSSAAGTGTIQFNATGASKDAVVSAIRIA